ncbi:MAG: galactokinase [Bacteroidota bacterium]
MNILQTLAQRYFELFKQSYIVVKAPGRLNIIGEHTDYNEGWVLPAAIDKHIYFALGKNADPEYIEIYSPFFKESARFRIEAEDFAAIPAWAKYLQAAIMEMRARGHAVKGVNGALDGNIPLGAGLSSSAALCCGFILGVAQLNDIELSKAEIALIGQATEHRVGLNCGIMDQFSVMFGKKDQVIGLDCQSMEVSYSPLALDQYQLVVFNSNIKHELAADSGYNDRRASCERVVQVVQTEQADVKSLRDIDAATIDRFQSKINPTDYKRAKYVLNENERVLSTMTALKAGDWASVGANLYASHAGMQQEYEITVPEIDLLVDLTRDIDAVVGSRMTGGGFGGCTIAFIEQSQSIPVIEHISQQYLKETGKETTAYEIGIDDGVRVVGNNL